MRALIEFLVTRSVGWRVPRRRHAPGRPTPRRAPGASRLERRIFDWDLDLAVVFRGLAWELGFRPRLQPIPVRIRRRR